MNTTAVIVSALAYTAVTFPLAIIWHIGLFKDRYQKFGYFEGEPSFMLGLLAIVLQGIILSALYPFVDLGVEGISGALLYSLIAGAFFWTSHVLALIAKQKVPSTGTFVLMETFYLILQFGIYGILLGIIFSNFS